jgi:hypothetical protein
MRTDTASRSIEAIPGQSIASRRVLRLALGTSLSLGFSQAMAWELSFIAPIFTMFLLATPTPAPTLKMGVGLVFALLAPVIIGAYVLLPFFVHLHSVGVLLVALALYHAFYLTARGAPPVIGTLLTIGITLNVAIGSVSVDAVSIVTTGVAFGAIAGVVFVWIAHALLPDPPELRAANEPKDVPPKPSANVARLRALRSLAVVLPVAIWFLFSPASASYIVVMMKVAAMAQEAEAAGSKNAGRSLIQSTFWGGVAAVVAWQLLSIWPSLIFYTLLIAIAALLYGRRIFEGTVLSANGAMWSYAFLTMILLLAPAVLDSMGGSAAGAAFWSRLLLVGVAAIYGSFAVTIFDIFWPTREPDASRIAETRRPA